MKVLSKYKVLELAQEGKMLSAKQGTAILDKFERNQSHLYEIIFGELSDEIAKENRDMAYLFLDLCFDIIFIYTSTCKDIKVKSRDNNWLKSKISLLDAELKSLDSEKQMSVKFKQLLNKRFIQRNAKTGIQLELMVYLDNQVKNYAGFQNSRKKAIHITNNLLFVVVRLMDDIYDSHS
jgi:hypothetical protein